VGVGPNGVERAWRPPPPANRRRATIHAPFPAYPVATRIWIARVGVSEPPGVVARMDGDLMDVALIATKR
jgi:hypothetical protein